SPWTEGNRLFYKATEAETQKILLHSMFEC
ncbi:unnamed protein product, partial [marine sediment metagenome]